MAPQPNTHWDNPEFDELFEHALATNDEAERAQRVKSAYQLAKDNAPPGTITAGKFRLEGVWKKVPANVINAKGQIRAQSYRVNLEVLRRFLEKEGLLDDEDSSE